MTRRVAALLVALAALAAPAFGQTGTPMPSPVFEPDTDTGGICAGCKLYSYAAGTTTPQSVYTDAALATPHANPVVLDSAGRATIFLDPALSYKFTLTTSADVTIWTKDNVTGPYASVLTVSAADTRGIQITRTGADAGLSIESSGSGKVYGIVANTSGGLRIQDDSDSTPRVELTGDDVNIVGTGTTTISGAAAMGSTLAVTGAATFSANVTGSATVPRFILVESDASADNGRWTLGADAEQLSFSAVNDASSSSNTIFVANRTGTTVDEFGLRATATTNTGRYNSATLQPGFLAYNSSSDTPGDPQTIEFDTEVYDTAGNFTANTFTAPVTGYYHLCAFVTWSGNSNPSTAFVRIVTSNRTYVVGAYRAPTGAYTAGNGSCVIADMDASDTATVQLADGIGTLSSVGGSSSPYQTWFSGRLVP